MAESEQEKTRPASGSDIRTEGSSDKADNPDEETDPFDKIIARIKRDISEKAKRHPGRPGPKAALTEPMFYVTGNKDAPSSLNVCTARAVAPSSRDAAKPRGIRTKAVRAATVTLPTGSTGDAGGNWRSKDRHYSVWECRTPFVFTSARLDRIRRIEEEELETGPEGAGDSERRRAVEDLEPQLGVHSTLWEEGSGLFGAVRED
ncbi:hypothetical protein BaRGS_00024421, partial [Batillaria attramentaria]